MKYPMKYLVVSDQMALQVILGFFRTNRRMDSLDDNWGTMLGNPKKTHLNPLSAIKSPHSLPSGKLLHNELENHHFLAG